MSHLEVYSPYGICALCLCTFDTLIKLRVGRFATKYANRMQNVFCCTCGHAINIITIPTQPQRTDDNLCYLLSARKVSAVWKKTQASKKANKVVKHRLAQLRISFSFCALCVEFTQSLTSGNVFAWWFINIFILELFLISRWKIMMPED